MKIFKKITCVILCFLLLLSSVMTSYAAKEKDGSTTVTVKESDEVSLLPIQVLTQETLNDTIKNYSVYELNSIEKSTTSDYIYSNRTYFYFYSNKEQNKFDKSSILSAQDVFSKSTFFHNSYVEDYTSWLGHGYHIHFSARDASYITNLGWVGADVSSALLVYYGVLTGGIGIVVGAVATVAVLTFYWVEQNDDGSIDIWSPDILRPNSIENLTGGAVDAGTDKVGNHWYPLVH